MAGTLGVATLSYLPWAILCWSGIIFAIIYGASGIGIAKLKKINVVLDIKWPVILAIFILKLNIFSIIT